MIGQEEHSIYNNYYIVRYYNNEIHNIKLMEIKYSLWSANDIMFSNMYKSSSIVCYEGDVHLVSQVFESPSTVTGVLEVCVNSNYTSVCTDSMDIEEPEVQALAEFACEGLGYTGLVCWYI